MSTNLGRCLLLVYHCNALEEISQESYLIEKDPTPYLFRRNYATHLYCLEFPEAEIQYLLGHDIEDSMRYRNYYTNPDEIYRFFERMKRHPYNKVMDYCEK